MNPSHRWASAARAALLPAGSDAPDRASFVMLLAFVVAAPWLAEATLPARFANGLATPVGGLLIPTIAFAIGTTTFFSRWSYRSFRPVALSAAALGMLTLLGGLQLLPLPEPALERISPVSVQIYHESGEILRVYGKPPLPARISIAPARTIDTLLRIGGNVCLLLSAWCVLRLRPRRRLFLGLLFASAVVQVLAAAMFGPRGQPVRGRFPSAADFAAYLLVLLPLASGWLWAEVLTNADRGRGSETGDRLAERITPFLLRSLCWVTLAAGMALARSVTSLLAAAAGFMALFALTARDQVGVGPGGRRARANPVFALLTFGAVAAALVASASKSGGAGVEDPAPAIWRTSWLAGQQFPALGSGYGAFADAFRRVQPRHLTGLIEDAHSDLLQLLVTGGAGGALLGLLLYGSFLALLLRRWRPQRHREERALALAGVGVLVSFGIDGVFRFNLGTPAVPATLACVLGLALAAGSESPTVTVPVEREP